MKALILQTLIGVFGLAAGAAARQASDSTATVSVRSDPSPMRVYADTHFVGTTPIDSLRLPPGTVVFRLTEIDPRLWPGSPIADTLTLGPGEHAVRNLTAPEVRVLKPAPLAVTTPIDGGEESYLGVYVAAGGAIAAGATAAYFKQQADIEFASYEISGDSQTLGRVRWYDTLSAVSLVTAQVALGLLIYQLLTR